MTGLDAIYIRRIVREALCEDIGSGDITTLLTVDESASARAVITSKSSGRLAGMDVAAAVFAELDPDIDFRPQAGDGDKLDAGEPIAIVTGLARPILTGERVALNFLQRMSGIASLTARYVALVKGEKARIVDTRKTTPGLRPLEKYAVVQGGGFNHRFGLSDGILIKDNHIAASGGIGRAIAAAKKSAPHTLKIEIEVTTLEQLREAIAASADAVLLDNMTIEMMREAVGIAAGRVLTEASGSVSEDNVREIAETGVDIISVGALTHSAPSLDISLDIEPGG